LEAFQQSKLGKIGKIAFLDENDGLILLEAEKIHNSIPWTKDTTTELLKEFQRYIGLKFADMKLEFGICQEEKTLLEVRECVKKCQKVLKMGSIIFPEKDIWEYEMLGPLTWIEIPENELKEMLRKYREMMEEEKNIELLKTLKIYLENNMNYSVTAEKMYVHINTIRKRIDKVNDLVKIDWEDHVDRLKMEILLQFLGLEE
jgi:purine catabolism regulator